MIVEFELPDHDLVAFSVFHHRESPAVRRQFCRALLVPPAIWLFFCLFVWHEVDPELERPLQTFLNLLPLFCGVPLYMLWFLCSYRRRLAQMAYAMYSEGEGKSMTGPRRLQINEHGIAEESSNHKTWTAWDGVERVVRCGDYLYIYIGPVMAYVVPRRAFTSAG